MISKKVFYTAVIFSLAAVFAACSNSSGTDKYFHTDNLKKEAESVRESLQWTQEIEKNRLTQKIDSNDYISSSIKLTPNSMIAYEAGKNHPVVYPELDDLGSLDISDLDANIISLISDFCQSYVNEKECETFFVEDQIYPLVLFMYDAKDFVKTNARWLMGKAFVTDNAIQVPVRFANAQGTMLVNVYVKEVAAEKTEYKIIDLEIIKITSNNERGGENGK